VADEDRDERVSARYRELARAEPPARLDDAILAASRRAVQAGPAGARRQSWSRRMALPVSLAAVVVLSVMVGVHVNEERPDLVSVAPSPPSAPPSAPAPAPVPAPAPARDAPPPVEPDANVAPPRATADARKPAPDVGRSARKQERQKDEVRAEVSREQEAPKLRQFAPDPAPAPAPATVPAGPAAAPVEDRAAMAPQASPPPPAPAAKPAPRALGEAAATAGAGAASGRQPAQARERAEVSQDASTLAKRNDAETPEKQLERIAELRREGRHAEADRLYAEFRQRYPAYRFSEEMLEKVRPR
jgi:hypothetical protein